jgi:hypothetical protein
MQANRPRMRKRTRRMAENSARKFDLDDRRMKHVRWVLPGVHSRTMMLPTLRVPLVQTAGYKGSIDRAWAEGEFKALGELCRCYLFPMLAMVCFDPIDTSSPRCRGYASGTRPRMIGTCQRRHCCDRRSQVVWHEATRPLG